MSSVFDIFTYIGVGVVVGALVGFIFGLVGNPEPWLVGAVAGVVGSIAGWFVVRRISASTVESYRMTLPPDEHED
jgi:F0F1-type ATP synthase assembly protein I